jgi:hypothetical protein
MGRAINTEVTMSIRFFTKGNNTKLFMLAIDEEKEELRECFLSNGTWEDTSDLMDFLIKGSTEIDEIDEKTASELYKDKGFEEAMSKFNN